MLQGRAEHPFPGDELVVRWRVDVGEGSKASPAIADGAVYVGGADGRVRAVDLAEGRILWQKDLSPAENSGAGLEVSPCPLILDDRIIVGDSEGVVRGLDRADGRVLWEARTEGEIVSSANSWGDLVLVGSYDHRLHCLDPSSGSIRWTYEADNYVHATPAVAGAITFLGGCDPVFRAIDLATSGVSWERDLGAPLPSPPTCFEVAGELRVAVGSMGGDVTVMRASDGSSVWTRNFEGESFYGSFAFAEGRLVAPGRDLALRCLNAATGEELWSLPNRAGFDSSPLVAGRTVYAPGLDGRVHVVDLMTGAEGTGFLAGAPIEGSPAAAEGVLVFSDNSGKLFCLECSDDPAGE